MKRTEYLSKTHKLRADVNTVEENLCVWDYEGAYKKLLMIGLDAERLATEISKDDRYKNLRIVLDKDRKKTLYSDGK